jgi:A/G-specific adenine glycosylase
MSGKAPEGSPLPDQEAPVPWATLQAAVLQWYAKSGRDLPWRRTRDPYAILVSEVMLQQTQVDRVLPKYRAFLERFPTLAALASAPPGEVIRAWQGLGYNRRAVRLQEAARAACRREDGALPDTLAGLMALEGIGRYTAAAVACFAFGRPEPVLDTNARRVLGRVALGPEGPLAKPALLWRLAEEALPPEAAYAWNQALMDLGARICQESRPACLICPARSWCRSAGRLGPSVRERRVPYSTGSTRRFVGSTRYFRGRIVDCLRALPPGQSVWPAALGALVKDGYAPADEAWLEGLLGPLQRDGLLTRRPDGSVSLP